MKNLFENVAIMMGRDPRLPEPGRVSAAAKKIHEERSAKKREKETAREITALREGQLKLPKKWRRRRWLTLIVVNLLFVLSYRFDVQLVEGALTASRFLGFHMADLYSAFQVMVASRLVLTNLVIGTTTILILCFVGGRTYCAWVCPYHLPAELAEMLHEKLVKKKLVRNHTFDRRTRIWLWLIFILLAFLTGYTVYETISPTGILSRALIYGPGLVLLWVGLLLLFEIFYSRRAWCRYACPIGLTYGFFGAAAPIKVTYNLQDCVHDGNCRIVCEVPHVLHVTRKKRAHNVRVDLGADCTRCGRCIDACPTNSLNYSITGIGKLS